MDFVNSRGQQTAYYEDEAFWFGQAGTVPSTGTFYQTLGWQVGVYVNGSYYSVGYKTRGTSMQVDERDSGGLRYTLWKIPYNTVVKDLKSKYPSVNFTSLQDKTVNSRFYFDAIVRIYTNGAWTGDINNNGTTSWGYVYRSHYELAYGSYIPWGDTLINQMRALFDISKDVSGSAKPQLPAPSTYAVFAPPGASGYQSTTHYKVPGKEEYWVNIKDQFSIYSQASIDKSTYGNTVFPDYQYLYLDKKNSEDVKIYSYLGTDQWHVHSGYSGNFQNTSSSFWHSSTDWSNYLIGHTRMRATKDGQTYYLKSASVKYGQSSGYKDSGQVLKTDGKVPTTNWDQASKITDINNLYILQQNIYDSGSGLVANSPYAKVYMKGSSNKGSNIYLYKSANYFDYQNTINLSSHLGNNYGTMIVEIYARDNVGNEGLVSSKEVNRPYPSPTSSSIVIKDYEYEDSTTKWVKADNEFLIKQEGYMNGGTSLGSRISLSTNGSSGESGVLYGTTMTSTGYWYMTNNLAGISRSQSNKLSLSTSGIKTTAVGNHYLKADKTHNGKKYWVWGRTESYYDKTYAGSWMKESKMLGIDAVGPNIDYTKTGRDKVTLTVKDNESGLKKTVITRKDGTTQESNSGTIVVDLKNSTSTQVVATDNVGNTSTITIGDIKTKVVAGITTNVVTVNGKKQLRVNAVGKVTNPVPGKVMTWNLKGTGDGIKFTSKDVIHTSTGSAYSYTFMIDDIYNQSYGPGLSYNSDGVTYSYVDLDRISDLLKSYNFTLEEKYDYESTWIKEATHSATFASGEKDYHYKIYKTTNGLYDPLPIPKLVMEGKTDSSVNVNGLEYGNYYIEMHMKDFNGNPSGTTRLDFKHIQPITTIDLGVEITAVKDIAWEKETYPITFDPNKYPVGIKYKFDGNPIKLGYAVNYAVWVPIEHLNPLVTEIEYTIEDPSGNRLIGYSNGVTFEENDRINGTGYLHQLNNIPSTRGRFWFKHYLPADATFKYANGTPYEGDVIVYAKFKFEEQGKTVYRDTVLYGVTTESTALDDLQLDKQR